MFLRKHHSDTETITWIGRNYSAVHEVCTKRLPRISIYDYSVDILANYLQTLMPEIVHDTFITIDDLSASSKISDCIIVTYEQVINNMDSFMVCRYMFRYIEISALGVSDNDTNMLYKKLRK